MAKLIAIAGNPNTGKSTVFNALTGLRQRTGNYPGVTVEKKMGQLDLGGETVEVLDLPGTYSLDASSPDERVVVEVLSGVLPGQPRPDLILVVVDASNLRRNLFLASQIAEVGIPMVLCLNLWDVALRRNLRIDVAALSEQLGVEVVTMNARQGRGLEELRAALARNLVNPQLMRCLDWPPCVQAALEDVRRQLLGSQVVPLTAPEQGDAGASAVTAEHRQGGFLAQRLLFDNSPALLLDLKLAPERARPVLEAARQQVRQAGLNPGNAEAVLRYRMIGQVLNTVLLTGSDARPPNSESIDALLCHRWLGLGFFAAIMFFAFTSIYAWAGPIMDVIEALFGALGSWVEPALAGTPMVQSLVVDGLIGGVGGVLVFLPQIFILFLFIGLLEDTGYMARAAFLMDKLFSWCGLNGKCFIPLLSSFACAIPGILSARTIQDPKARLATILAAPLMSCSARLPVYLLFIGAFVEPRYGAWVAGLTLFLMHFIGLAVAAPLVWVLNRFVLKTPPQPFLLEMPSYRVPRARDVFLRMWLQGQEFLVRAGSVILAFSVMIWALLYFPHPPEVAEEVEAQFIAEKAAAWGVEPGAVADWLTSEDTPEAAAGVTTAAEGTTETTGGITELVGGKSEPAAGVFLTVEGLEVDRAEVLAALDNEIAGFYLEQSYLGRFGKAVQPIFAPAGFDWKLTVGVLASFPAREVIISTLGIIYNLGGDVDEESTSLRDQLESSTWTRGPRAGQPVYTLPTALALMVFFALCMQCGATVAVIARESSWKWAAFSFFSNTALAWVAAVLVYQLGSLFLI